MSVGRERLSYRVLIVETGQNSNILQAIPAVLVLAQEHGRSGRRISHSEVALLRVFELVSDFSMTHKFRMRKRRSTERYSWSFIDTR